MFLLTWPFAHAEDDVSSEEGPASRSEPHDTVVARTFDYENEAKCAKHTSVFLRSIQAAANAPGQGFAAIKVHFPACASWYS